MSFINNLFGTIAQGHTFPINSGISFIPDGKGGTIEIKGEAQWLGLKSRDMQKWAYDYCFPLASVIDRLAEADLTGTIEILRRNGKGKQDYATSDYARRLMALFANPNPLQSWEQFRGQQTVYKKIFGFCPVLPIYPAGMTADKSMAVAMINIPPWCFDVEGTKELLFQSQLEGIVKHYKVTLLGKTVYFTPDQLFILTDGFIQDENYDYLLPKSRLIGLDFAISNICAAMEADNVLLKKRGPLGFISHDAAATKDSVAGYLPMTPKEKDEIQASLQNYGLNWSQFQYVISRQAIKWNPMSFDSKQLGTKETVLEGTKAICNRFGYDYILYEASESTFANQSGAHKAFYQNNVIPNNQKDMNLYEMFFEAEENNAIITTWYGDLPVLQEDEMQKAAAAKAWNEALKIEWENNLITRNQWLTARGYDTIPDGDLYFKDEKKPEPVMIPINNEQNNPTITGNEGTEEAEEDVELAEDDTE
jgi:hypothetical protein